MSAHPCPLCGESKGYDEAGGGSLYCSACCRRVATNTAVSPRFRADNDTAWNATAAHAQGLRERIAELEAQRVPLTKAEITACCNESDTYKTGVWMRVHETTLERLVRAIERAHGIEEGKR